jgi:hypothetical protein
LALFVLVVFVSLHSPTKSVRGASICLRLAHISRYLLGSWIFQYSKIRFVFKLNLTSAIGVLAKLSHSVRYVSHHNAMAYNNFRSCCWKNDTFSFPIEARHLHICLKWLCQPEIGYTTLLFFKLTNPWSHWLASFINKGGRTQKTKWFQHKRHIFISISRGTCTEFVKISNPILDTKKCSEIMNSLNWWSP